ncbi:MAG: peptidoglycan-binding domain-containing protein [Pseudomonadota bacterium]
MPLKQLTAVALAASVMAIPAETVKADEFVGGLVGGLIGGAVGAGIVNHQNNQRQRTTTTRTRTVYVNPQASAQRAENRQVQTSLNYFGFPAGVADGALGPRSRSAISAYQVYMGFPATGRLNEYEKTLLLGAYSRAVAGGSDVASAIAKSPDGVRAVLKLQRDGTVTPTRTAGYAGLPLEVSQAVDEVANSSDPTAEQLLQRSGFIQLAELNGDGSTDYIIDTGLAGSSFWCNATACKTMVFASTPNGYRRNDLLVHSPTAASFDCIGGSCQVKSQSQTQLASTQPSQGSVPTFQTQPKPATTTAGLPVFNTAPKQKSLASFCSKVNLLTSSNGGFTTVSTMSDPSFTLSEQFCLARTYAMASGEELMSTVQGATPQQIEAQCDQFGGLLTAQIASLGGKPAAAVLNDVNGVILNSGMSADQLRTTSQICMASGYKTDNMQTALAGALLLTALGDRPVAELVGHHLQGGFGAAESDDLAINWYETALGALDSGSAPVFAPDQVDRIDVLRQATLKLSGADTATTVPTSAQSGKKLPVFSLGD